MSSSSDADGADSRAWVDGELSAGSSFGDHETGHAGIGHLLAEINLAPLARSDSRERSTGHMPLLWRPLELAEVLNEIARELRSVNSPQTGDVMTMQFRSQATMLAIAASVSLRVLGVAPLSQAESPSPLFALVDAAAERLQTADAVAAVKYRTGGSVDDPQREQDVIDSVTTAAAAQKIDPGYVKEVFRNQIDATNAIEHARFAGWKLDPSTAPSTAPDLSASRATIDRLNLTMVTEIAAQWNSLHDASCSYDLDSAKSAVVAARQLDDLYQRALTYATHSYCR